MAGRRVSTEQSYRDRNTVERAINKLRDTRATATRYEKRDFIYRGTIAVYHHLDLAQRPGPTRLPNTP